MNSILSSVKEILGIPQDVTNFDQTLIFHINTVFQVLRQLACGPKEGYQITGATNTWSEFLQNDDSMLQHVKSYMALKVRQLFDPPMNSTVSEALNRQVAELEWRINADVDRGIKEEVEDGTS